MRSVWAIAVLLFCAIPDRFVGQVFVGEHWVNRELLLEGTAWHYRDYSKSVVLAEAEVIARSQDRGLWAAEKPVAPWEFRKPAPKPEPPAAIDPQPTTPGAPPSKILPFAQPQPLSSDRNEATVYVTKTGPKYHTTGCRHLSKSMIAMPLSDAAARYQPCSVCHPPTAAKAAGRQNTAEPIDETVARSSGDGTVTGHTATGIPQHTGPRGGVYHYSKSGKKVYDKKK